MPYQLLSLLMAPSHPKPKLACHAESGAARKQNSSYEIGDITLEGSVGFTRCGAREQQTRAFVYGFMMHFDKGFFRSGDPDS